MAAVAPVVEYFRLVDDGTSTDTFTFETGNAATLLDFGTVDAGSNTLKSNVSEITAAEKGCQVYAIYNNKGGSTDTSDMQNAVLSVVNNEAGQQGNSNGVVYENKWINVVLNDHDENTESVALGRSAQDVTDDVEEGKLQLTAVGLNDTDPTEAGTIKGTANGGTLTGTNDIKNYARIKVWLDILANAPAGPHNFRLRTTYSYT